MRQNSGHPLVRITFIAMFRRWTASLLLIAVAAAGVFSAVLLHGLTARQEQALADTVANTVISCTVTNAKGTDRGHLRMPSAFVELLTGKRRPQDCALADHVKNVRAMAEMPLTTPAGAALRRILSVGSDPALSPAEGATVRFFPGWTEEALAGQEQICLIPADMPAADGFITAVDEAGAAVRLRVVGTVKNGPSGVIHCPFFLPWTAESSTAFLTDSCSFDLQNDKDPDESKAEIYRWFVAPDLARPTDGTSFGVLIRDEDYRRDLSQIRADLSALRLLLPILTAVCGGIGFFAGHLSVRGRRREFAVMRRLGLRRRTVVGLTAAEFAAPTLFGLLAGLAGGSLWDGGLRTAAWPGAALTAGVFFLGCTAAALRLTGGKRVKTED